MLDTAPGFLVYLVRPHRKLALTERGKEKAGQGRVQSGSGQLSVDGSPPSRKGTPEGEARSAGGWCQGEAEHMGTGCPQCFPLYKAGSDNNLILAHPSGCCEMR